MPIPPLPLEEADIRKLLPHQGEMCLIDKLIEWSSTQAICQSSAHLRSNHPLARNDDLGSATLIEVAAQAMALHGALLGQSNEAANNPQAAELAHQPDKHGVLAGLRRVTLNEQNISRITRPLSIQVTLTSGDTNTALYDFEVSADGHSLANGRATVLFAVAA